LNEHEEDTDMEFRFYVIKLSPPRWLRNLIAYVLLPLGALVGAAATVRAAVALTTFTAGTAIKAADVNANFTNLASAVNTLQQQVRPASSFHAWITAATSIPGGVVTKGVFDHVDYDLGSEYTASTGVFSPKQAGTYLVICQFDFLSTASTSTDFDAVILNNGGQIGVTGTTLVTSRIAETASVIVPLAAGDALTCAAYQTSATSQALNNIPGQARSVFSAARLY
jgi:hypothetical protein